MTHEQQLLSRGLHKHHTATVRIYVSRKPDSEGRYGYTELYEGRYGRGVRLLLPNTQSTMYSYVEYWVEG